MAQTRGLRQRIKSVHSIRQITKTMEMVATSRLKQALMDFKTKVWKK